MKITFYIMTQNMCVCVRVRVYVCLNVKSLTEINIS